MAVGWTLDEWVDGWMAGDGESNWVCALMKIHPTWIFPWWEFLADPQ